MNSDVYDESSHAHVWGTVTLKGLGLEGAWHADWKEGQLVGRKVGKFLLESYMIFLQKHPAIQRPALSGLIVGFDQVRNTVRQGRRGRIRRYKDL